MAIKQVRNNGQFLNLLYTKEAGECQLNGYWVCYDPTEGCSLRWEGRKARLVPKGAEGEFTILFLLKEDRREFEGLSDFISPIFQRPVI